MKVRQGLLAGIGVGALAMYILDPDRGRRRRAIGRDRFLHVSRKFQHTAKVTMRDIRQRIRGVAAETRSRFETAGTHDTVLQERVRSKIGRVVSHPHAIRVSSQNGAVTLEGPILSGELGKLVSAAESVPGVNRVVNRLEPHTASQGIPALQGGVERAGQRFELLQANWSPSARLIMAVAGLSLSLYGLRRRDGFGALWGIAGLGAAGRATTNLNLSGLLGIGNGRRGLSIQKTICIAAPVGEVYSYWRRFENFPRFMRHVRQVENIGNDRSRWVASGPAGVLVRWEAVITSEIEDELIAWKSVENSKVETEGEVRFEPVGDNLTRLHVHMSYKPPAGAIGHALAWLSGTDPKRAMDDDLIRLKSLIENGRTHMRGELVTRDTMPGVAS